MKTNRSQIAFAMLFVACGGDRDKADDGAEGITAPGSGVTGETASGTTAPTTGEAESGDAEAGEGPPPALPKYDVGAGGDYFCQGREDGIYCDDFLAIECLDDKVESNNACLPDICLEGTGCVTCLEGQYHCLGDEVLLCDHLADPPVWQNVATCDPAATVCDIPTGTCVPHHVVGGNTPTGVYYQFAEFVPGASTFNGGGDVDSFENKIFVVYSGGIDVYEVELLDSDGDGVIEPNQHPDNPDKMGPMEERVLTYLDTYTIPAGILAGVTINELYALDDRIYIGGNQLTEFIIATGATSTISMTPPALSRFSQIGYDDLNGIWYASTENPRRVHQMNPTTGSWGVAFDYPDLAGSHMDGIEVVVDPSTFTPFVYVSDMTSDFIGQYRLDPTMGYVQENLFEYDGTVGQAVEGMGFGAFNHFWATSGQVLYELGGGDLQDFLDPPK